MLAVKAAFWRGGTSKGLVLRADALAKFAPPVRDRIILAALGSPDPYGRQIGGLGGGASSLSKVSIVGLPQEGLDELSRTGPLPGVRWASDGAREINGRLQTWDCSWSFGQVPIRDGAIDWSATCGNMLAAVALFALGSPSMIPYTTLFRRAKSLPHPESGPLLFPLYILSASNGQVVTVFVPLCPDTLQIWEPTPGDGTAIKIAGVPGDALGIRCEIPAPEGGLVTGRVLDEVEIDAVKIPVSILTSGLPNIFLDPSWLSRLPAFSPPHPPLPANLLSLATAALSSIPQLPAQLERIRIQAATRYSIPLSLASPKIVLVEPMAEGGYTTSGGDVIAQSEGDFMVRATSSGDWHASIPGSTLAALNFGAGVEGTLIHSLCARSEGVKDDDELVSINAAHPAGIASSSARFVDAVDATGTRTRKCESVVLMRTAREIMRGEVMAPNSVLDGP